jgi:hypothetical protein
MVHLHHARWALLALTCAAAGAQTPAVDSPDGYTHTIPLTVSGKNAVVQLRLPPAAYLNAHSAALDDLRIFDGAGKALPFALLQPGSEARATRQQWPVKVFPVGVTAGDTRDVRNDVEIKTSADGSVTSISTRHAASGKAAGEPAGALVLDLGPKTVPVHALVFSLPPGVTNYEAQVRLEVSNDLHEWDAGTYASLSWLANSSGETLVNNRMELNAGAFRYARLTWMQGKPLSFAAINAESRESTAVAAAQDSITVKPHEGRVANDLAYDSPIAVPVSRLGVRFAGQNVVMPALVGHYVQLPSVQGSSATRWDFSARTQTTFFQIGQDGKQRASADIGVDDVHAANWVIRPQAPVADKPELRLSWTPATLVFLGSGAPPYSVRVGRDKSKSMQRDVGLVAPGFSAAELQGLEQAVAGPVQAGAPQAAGSSDAEEAGKAARQRMMMLWGVLLLGVGVLGFMAWKLIKQMKQPE